MKYFFIGILMLFVTTVNPAAAGTSVGPISLILALSGDVVVFAAGAHPGKPACSIQGDDWAFSLTTPAGKAMYALLLLAKAQGVVVTVSGTNLCSAWGDREAPNFIFVSS